MGWGRDVSPWIETQTKTGKVYVKNPDFYQQFFDGPIHLGEFEPYVTNIRLPKPPNTIRIFVLGESAALGWPESKFSFGKFLEAMLNKMFPEFSWEVFNICVGGINSHILRYLAEQSVFLEPDIVLIYMGNNEAHGTFGLMHSFQRTAPLKPEIVQIYIRLQKLYLFQQLRKISLFLKKFRNTSFGEGSFRFDTPLVSLIEKNYRTNLTAIIDEFTSRQIPVFVGTMVSNIRNWNPQESWFRKGISEYEVTEWTKHFQFGLEHFSNNQYSFAKEEFLRALEIDPTPALVHFLLGWCFLCERDYGTAKKHFIEARERDGFSFVRAKSFINQVIQTVISEKKNVGNELLFLVPVEEEMSKIAEDGIVGNNFLIDSCHFNIYGSYLTARIFLMSLIENYMKKIHLSIENRCTPEYAKAKAILGILTDENKILNVLSYSFIRPKSVLYNPFGECIPINLNKEIEKIESYCFPKSKREKNLRFQLNTSSFELLAEYFDSLKEKPVELTFRFISVLKELGNFREALYICDRELTKLQADLNINFILLDLYLSLNRKEYVPIIQQLLKRYDSLGDYFEDKKQYYSLRFLLLNGIYDDIPELCEKIKNKIGINPGFKVFAECVLVNLNGNITIEQKIRLWKELLLKYAWSWECFNFIYKEVKKYERINLYKELLDDLVHQGVDSPFPYMFLAYICEDQGNLEESITKLKSVILNFPMIIINYYDLSRLLVVQAEKSFEVGRFDDALELLQEAINVFPYYFPAWVNLMRLTDICNETDKIYEIIERFESVQESKLSKYLWEIMF